MYCPTCGEQIPNGSKFCLHCGKSTILVESSKDESPNQVTEWEYEDFTLPLEPTLYSVSDYSRHQAAQEFWQQYQFEIIGIIQVQLDQGWDPVGEIGPGNVFITEYGLFAVNTHWQPTAFRVRMRRPKTEALTREIDARPAMITINRNSSYLNAGRNFGAFIDGIKVGVIKRGASLSFEVRPGRHLVYLKLDISTSDEIELMLAPGDEVELYCKAGFGTALKLSQQKL